MPGHIRIWERAAGIILGRNGQQRFASGKIRPAGFIARRHFELRPAEFLDLEGMAIGDFIQAGQAALGSQVDLGIAQVDSLRDAEGKIKTAQGIDMRLPGPDRIALMVGELIGHRSNRIPHQADIASLFRTHAPQPAFDVDFFAGAIHLAVIEHVPAQGVGRRARFPTGIIPIIRRVQQHGRVRAPAGQQVGCAGWNGRAGGAIRAGGDCGAALVGLNADTRQGRAVLQVSRPDDHVRGIRVGIHADLGDLHPGLNGLGIPLPFIVLGFEHARRRLDDHYELTKALF